MFPNTLPWDIKKVIITPKRIIPKVNEYTLSLALNSYNRSNPNNNDFNKIKLYSEQLLNNDITIYELFNNYNIHYIWKKMYSIRHRELLEDLQSIDKDVLTSTRIKLHDLNILHNIIYK